MRVLIWRDARVMTSIKTADIGYRCPALELIADPGSEFWARAHAADVLRAWQLEHLAGLVDLLVAEMVLNSVRRSSTHIAVIMRTTGSYLVIDVWDAGLRLRDELPVTKALADRFEVVAAERGGRLVRAWISRNSQPDVLTIERQLRALSTHSASLLVRDETPTDDMITRVIEGLRALNGSTRVSAIPAEDSPRRFAREG